MSLTPVAEQLFVEIDSPSLTVEPGGAPVTLTLRVHNNGNIVDRYTVHLSGLDPDWFDLTDTAFSLFPGDSQEVELRIQPPMRSAQLRAGAYPFQVSVRSAAGGGTRTVDGEMVIRGSATFRVELLPQRRVSHGRARFVLRVTNTGLAAGALALDARDAEDGLRFHFGQDRAPLVAAGQSLNVPLDVTPVRRPWVGAERTYGFEVSATADRFDALAEPLVVAGQLVHRPWLPSLALLWRIARWSLVPLAAVAAFNLVPLQIRCAIPGNGPDVMVLGKGCPRPVAAPTVVLPAAVVQAVQPVQLAQPVAVVQPTLPPTPAPPPPAPTAVAPIVGAPIAPPVQPAPEPPAPAVQTIANVAPAVPAQPAPPVVAEPTTAAPVVPPPAVPAPTAPAAAPAKPSPTAQPAAALAPATVQPQPTTQPTAQPTPPPTAQPTAQPTLQPTAQPTAPPAKPTAAPAKPTLDVFATACGPIPLRNPGALALDRQANLFISDTDNNRLVKLSPKGACLDQWSVERPARFALDTQASVAYLTDTTTSRLLKLTLQSRKLETIATAGRQPGQLDRPAGITVDRDDNPIVADFGNNRVQRFSPQGKPLQQWAVKGATDVAIESDGDVFATGAGASAPQTLVLKLARDGKPSTIFTSPTPLEMAANNTGAVFGTTVSEVRTLSDAAWPQTVLRTLPSGQFTTPPSFAIDDQGKLFLVSTATGQILTPRLGAT